MYSFLLYIISVQKDRGRAETWKPNSTETDKKAETDQITHYFVHFRDFFEFFGNPSKV